MQTPPPLEAESSYLSRAGERLRAIFGERIVGVYAGGSYALGDYLPGRSDLDVAAVVAQRPSPEQADAVTEHLRHESLPCPARCLELVVYGLDTARSGSATPEFELNLDTGAGMPLSMQSRSDTRGVGSHWFAIDRSVLAQAGLALWGPPAGEVFALAALHDLLPVLVESVRWHRDDATDPGDAVLNACRALLYAEEARWSSKPAAGRWAVTAGLAPPDLVAQAVLSRTEGATLDRADVEAFLGVVEARLRATGART